MSSCIIARGSTSYQPKLVFHTSQPICDHAMVSVLLRPKGMHITIGFPILRELHPHAKEFYTRLGAMPQLSDEFYFLRYAFIVTLTNDCVVEDAEREIFTAFREAYHFESVVPVGRHGRIPRYGTMVA